MQNERNLNQDLLEIKEEENANVTRIYKYKDILFHLIPFLIDDIKP